LVANNLRDIPSDTASGKRTLAVRLGDPGTRLLYVGCLAGAFAAVPLVALRQPAALLALLALPLARGPALAVGRAAAGPALIPVLGGTGKLQLAFGLLLALGLAL
ncbi:MAG: 1,4-dihydroxy-2-naphthoate polyprenyltransferase, partial [Acidimicrobiales bacterium]